MNSSCLFDLRFVGNKENSNYTWANVSPDFVMVLDVNFNSDGEIKPISSESILPCSAGS